MMKKYPTLLIKGAVIVLGLIVLALCIFALPSVWKGGSAEFPEASAALLLIVIGMYATAVPFFIALWQTWKLLNYIDRNIAFSELSLKALRNIRYSAIIIGIFYMGGVPLLLPIAQADDAPGIVLIGFAIACIPFVISASVSIFQKLIQSALDMRK